MNEKDGLSNLTKAGCANDVVDEGDIYRQWAQVKVHVKVTFTDTSHRSNSQALVYNILHPHSY